MSEKTEEATPKRQREARAKGQVARSRDLVGALLLLAAALALGATAPGWVEQLRGLVALVLSAIASPRPASLLPLLGAAMQTGLSASAPVLAATVAAAVLGTLAQTGPVFASEAIGFDLARLDPVEGARRLVSLRGLVELLRGLVKLAVVGVVAYLTLRDALHGLGGLVGRGAEAALEGAASLGRTLLVRVGAATFALGLLDLLYQRWQLAKDQRMSKDEVKREHKDAEGDPHAKQERERVRREVAQHDLLESVRSATVLVVNPTHLAVALRFEEDGDQAAPEVVGKGQDELARRMIRAAEEAGVPVLRDVPLARGLFELEVGDEIPERLYDAVAAVLRAAWAEEQAR